MPGGGRPSSGIVYAACETRSVPRAGPVRWVAFSVHMLLLDCHLVDTQLFERGDYVPPFLMHRIPLSHAERPSRTRENVVRDLQTCLAIPTTADLGLLYLLSTHRRQLYILCDRAPSSGAI